MLNARLWAKGHPERAGTRVNQPAALQPSTVPGSQEAPMTDGCRNEWGRLCDGFPVWEVVLYQQCQAAAPLLRHALQNCCRRVFGSPAQSLGLQPTKIGFQAERLAPFCGGVGLALQRSLQSACRHPPTPPPIHSFRLFIQSRLSEHLLCTYSAGET